MIKTVPPKIQIQAENLAKETGRNFREALEILMKANSAHCRICLQRGQDLVRGKSKSRRA